MSAQDDSDAALKPPRPQGSPRATTAGCPNSPSSPVQTTHTRREKVSSVNAKVNNGYSDSDSDADSDSHSHGHLHKLRDDGELKDVYDTMLSKEDADRMGVSIYREILSAVYAARYLSSFLMIMSLFVGYQITISPYQMSSQLDRAFSAVPSGSGSSGDNLHGRSGFAHNGAGGAAVGDLGLIRPVLTAHEQAGLRANTMHAHTNFILPEGYRYTDTAAAGVGGSDSNGAAGKVSEIKVQFQRAVDKHGSFHPPQFFYDGVMFGVTDTNSHTLRYTGQHQREEQTLESTLQGMTPKPTFVSQRRAQNADTGWNEEGLAVYFSYADLKAQGKLSSDKLQPWKRVAEDVLTIARDFKQVYVTVWYPHEYGHAGDDKAEQALVKENPYRFTSILQKIIPTRTGLTGISSHVPVWMSAVDQKKPRRLMAEKGVKKEWSKDDHWSQYKPGGSKHVQWSEEELKAMNYEYHPGVKAVRAGQEPEDLADKLWKVTAEHMNNNQMYWF
jgi:hypothetical protein